MGKAAERNGELGKERPAQEFPKDRSRKTEGIAERHGDSYYHYHQGIIDKRSIPTNVNIPDNEKAAHGCLGDRQTVDGGFLLFE